MKKVKKYWMIAMLGGLLMATLVGVAGARPNDSPAAAISRRITIPPGHFIAHDSDDLYHNGGLYVYSKTDGAPEYLTAPVVFPTGQSVVVESVTFWAQDENASHNLCVALYKTDPTVGGEKEMAYVCSTGSSSADPRHFTDSTITANPVKHGKGVYLQLKCEDDTNLRLYGVRIQYHHGTT